MSLFVGNVLGDGNVNSKIFNPELSVAVDFSNTSRTRDTTTGDWDYGYYKGECAPWEAVTGIAQTTSGQLTKVLCTQTYQEHVSGSCYARVFANGENRGNTPPGIRTGRSGTTRANATAPARPP